MLRTKKGFTLVELMVVIVIIGILAALAIPKFTEASTKAKMSEIPTVMASWDHAVLARIAEVGEVPTALNELIFEPQPSKWFSFAMTQGGAQPALYTGTVATGKSVGPYDENTAGATSTIDSDSNVDHALGGFAAKYLPNWELSSGSGS